MYTWPYVEDQTIASLFDQNKHFYEDPNTKQYSLDGTYAKQSPLYYCASDRPGAMWKGDPYWRCRGNYVINCGNMSQPADLTDPARSPKLGLAPFGYKDHVSFDQPRASSFKDFTDGTSHTMLLSEVIMAASDETYDIRGDMLNDGEGCTPYMTIRHAQ